MNDNDRRELTIVSEDGHRRIIRFPPANYADSATCIANGVCSGTFSTTEGALLLRLLEQARQKDPTMRTQPPSRDPKRPMIESSVWPWYLRRALLLGAILAASLSVWCNQTQIRDWYARQVQPPAAKKQTHQQREREQLERDRPTRTPLRPAPAAPNPAVDSPSDAPTTSPSTRRGGRGRP